MQIDEAEDMRDREALLAVKDRVFSMALVHERLYGSQNLTSIDLDEYLKALVDEIVLGHKRPGLEVETRIEAEGMSLEADRMIPLGLIVTELVSNSMKHAFATSPRGRIELSLSRKGERIELLLCDNGEASSESFAQARAEGIGLQLVEALAAQLGGTLTRDTGQGCAYRLSFI